MELQLIKKSKERQKVVERLDKIIKINGGGKRILVGSWDCNILPNLNTTSSCQIIECVYSGSPGPMKEHTHENSTELFWQLTGTTTFSDGVVLHAGEHRIVPPKTLHSLELSEDGSVIVLVHPVETAYPLGGE